MSIDINRPPLRITEEDGSPEGFPTTLKFANGAVTDNGDGSFSIAAGAGGVTGSGASPRVAFWSGASTLTSDADFTFDGTSLNVVVSGIATTPTQGMSLSNTTAPSLGVPVQYSPYFVFSGGAFDDGDPGDAVNVRFKQEARPIRGAPPTGDFVISYSNDNGTPSWTDISTLSSIGGLSVRTVTTTINAIATSTTQAVAIQNTTAATAGVTVQYSPRLEFIGHAWLSLGGSDRHIRFAMEDRPVGSTATGIFAIMSSIDTGTASWTDRLTLTTGGVLSVASLTATGLTAGRVVFTSTGGLLAVDADFTFDGSQMALLVSGTSGGILIGTDALIYRRTTNVMALGSGDSFEVPGTIAVGTTVNSAYGVYSLITLSTNTSARGVRGELTITGAITSAFPAGGHFVSTVNAGANTLTYVTGVIFSTRTDATQSGTINEQYGADFDVWHSGSANIGLISAARGFTNIVNTSSGTITESNSYRAILNTASGGTNSNITTHRSIYATLNHTGPATIGTLTGFDVSWVFGAGSGAITTFIQHMVRNAGSNATITTQYGLYIATLTRASTNIGIFFEGSSGTAADGIRFSDVDMFRFAASTVGISGSLNVVTTATVGTSVLTPLLSVATAVTLTVRGFDTASGSASNVVLRGGDHSGMSSTGGTVSIRGGTGSSVPGTTTIFRTNGSTAVIQVNDTGIGFNAATPVAQSTGWAVSNVTSDKVLDANSTSIDELADVVGTLISYLLTRGDIAA